MPQMQAVANLADLTRRAGTLLAGRNFVVPLADVARIEAGRIFARHLNVPIGELCIVTDRLTGTEARAQVIAVSHNETILAAIDPIDGLSADADILATGGGATIPVGDALIGRIIDSTGKPLDGQPAPNTVRRIPVVGGTPDDGLDHLIDTQLHTGVRAIDLFNTMGVGQRLAVFGAPGAGKSTLMGMITRHCTADVVIMAMIGERGREVREFIDRQMPPEVRSRCVTVVATSDRPAMERALAGHAALAIAEDFRAQGKEVLLIFDSVTRFARAMRDVGLAAGEEPVRNGFTPSVYAELPKLIERAGKTSSGAITALFTVLLENNGKDDPIAEEVNSLVDGYIMLDSSLAASGHYPSIDIERSKSRLMSEIAPPQVVANASRLRALSAKYRDIELLLQVGEYSQGNDAEADAAIAVRPALKKLLIQDIRAATPMAEGVEWLQAIIDDL